MKKLLLLGAFAFGMGASAQTTYCTPVFSSGCMEGDRIEDFKIPSVNFQDLGTGCAANAYDDKTSMVITLQAGISTDYTIRHGFSLQKVRIWIDFNNDGVFDDAAPELVSSASSFDTQQTLGAITIPTDVAVGEYRMRVATRFNAEPIPCNTEGYGEAHDYTVSVLPPPTCMSPNGISSVNVTETTADVSWNASTSTVEEGYVVYYSTEDIAPTAETVLDNTNSVTVAATETSATLTGLTPGTDYYAWVRANCSATDSSLWSSSMSFTTVCSVDMPGYVQDFTTFLPNCWSEARGGDPATGYTSSVDSNWISGGFLNDGNVGSATINLNSNTNKEWLISPTFDLSGGASYMLSFKYGITRLYTTDASEMGSDDKVMVLASSDNGTTWTVIQTWEASNAPSNNGQFIHLDLTPYASATTKVAIYATDGAVDDAPNYKFYVDDFEVNITPSCVSPSSVLASNVGAHTADISWNASVSTIEEGYVVYYSTEDTVPTDQTVLDDTNSVTVAGTENTTTLTGLDPVTTYYVWVKANCSATESSEWSSVVPFKTLCGIYEVGYRQDFGQFVPTCWFEAKGGDPATGYSSITDAAWIASGFLNNGETGSAKINLYTNSRKDWLVSPTFNLPTGETYILSFDYGVTKYNSTEAITIEEAIDDKVIVVVSNDDGATWQEVHTWDASNMPSNTRNHFVLDVSSYVSEITRIAIYATDGTVDDTADYDFFIDNFKIEAQADCPTPMGLEVTNVGYDTTEVSWTAITDISSVIVPESYTVYYSTENVMPAATITLDNTNSVTVAGTESTAILTGLTEVTTYYIWVRSNCSATSSSEWSFSNTFTTECSPKVPEYTEDFTEFLPGCWKEAKGGDPASGYQSLANSEWTYDGFLNDGTTGAAKVLLSYSGTRSWLISPVFDLSDTANLYTLSFDYGITKYDSTEASEMGSDDKVIVLVSNDNGATWQEVEIWDAFNTPSNTSTTFTLDITNYASATTKVAFYATDGDITDAQTYNFYVDNFKVESSPNTGTINQELVDLEVYPNPATDVINISNDKVIDTVEVYDINGRRIINQNIGDVRTSVQVNQLATGTYFVKVLSDGKTATKQVIVK